VDDAETGGVEGAVVALTLTSKSARRIGAVPGQFIRHLVLVDGGLAFVSMRATAEVEMSSAAGGRRSVTTGTYVSGAAICGDSLLTADGSGNRIVINRRTFKGTLVAGLTEGPMDTSPSCSATGQRWCYVRYRPGGGVACCEDRRCTQITDKDVLAARISPDGSRIVFTAAEKRGLAIYVGRHDGSGVRELTVTETLCSPGWSSSHTVWVSRRHGRDSVWREIDVDSGHDTGKTIAGTTDCMNGDEDPASPVERDVRVVAHRTAQVRVVPSRSLRVPE
jgi:hypothetical protein